MYMFDLLFSTSGFSLLFFISIFLLRSLGDGKGLPGSSWRQTEKAELVMGCAARFSFPAQKEHGGLCYTTQHPLDGSQQFYVFIPQPTAAAASDFALD